MNTAKRAVIIVITSPLSSDGKIENEDPENEARRPTKTIKTPYENEDPFIFL